MKVPLLFAAVCGIVAVASGETQKFCYGDVVRGCKGSESIGQFNCSANYGGASKVLHHLQQYANSHITESFKYLLMSTHFGNYEKSRPGFEKLYRSLSDETWNDAIELIKHITKRGGTMDFKVQDVSGNVAEPTKESYTFSELSSLARALDTQKTLAEKAFEIHAEVSKTGGSHDAEIAHYLEEEFIEKHAGKIRTLAGYNSDLKQLLTTHEKAPQPSLSIYLFDEFLQKNI